MTVRKAVAYVPVRDEDIVDGRLGTLEDQVAAAARIEERQRAAQRQWQALPLTVRVWRRARWRLGRL